jgi:hypothetical protein
MPVFFSLRFPGSFSRNEAYYSGAMIPGNHFRPENSLAMSIVAPDGSISVPIRPVLLARDAICAAEARSYKNLGVTILAVVPVC